VKLSRLTIALYVGLIFASGLVLGVFGHSLYSVTTVRSNPSEDVRKKTLAEMQSRMKLSDEQVSKINSIMDETRAKFHEVRERYRPDLDALQKDQRQKVRAILTPAQLAEYEKMLKEREEREEHQKQNNGRGTGPGI
jgi:hypothetical protein